jgi:hypothetical protein
MMLIYIFFKTHQLVKKSLREFSRMVPEIFLGDEKSFGNKTSKKCYGYPIF